MATGRRKAAVSRHTPTIKDKENLKESNKREGLTPEQIKSCPDCNGVGMWYPEGPGKGVARCYHPSLMRES